LRHHVLDIATEMGYYDSVAPAKLQHIALFTHTFSTSVDLDTFHTAVLHGVESECRQRDIQLSYSIVEPGEVGTALILKKVKERKIEGALLVSIDNRELVKQLLDLAIPVVVINDDYRGLPVDTFLPDNFTGGLLATQYLLSYGHRRILHITSTAGSRRRTVHQRFEGYCVALQDAGIPFERGLFLESALGVEEVRAGVRKLLETNECQFSAVFGANDEAAIGAMRALQDVGKRVPEDVAVIGFDDIATAALLTPALTTLHVDCKGMGMLAIRRLVDRFLDPDITPVRVELACKLIERQSVSRAPVGPC
jgi:DNA-binding LacI/PurR family transcriptional regulator